MRLITLLSPGRLITNTGSGYLNRIVILLLLLFVMKEGSYAQGPPSRNFDSLSMVYKFKKDSLDAAFKMDSLKGVIRQNEQNAKSNQTGFTAGNITIYVICIAVCIFLILIASASPKDSKYALALPDGSVRAIIAILAVVLYILAAVPLSLLVTSSTIPTDVTKTLGTLVVAISAFYFGSKTAEQGNKNVVENLNKIINKNTDSGTPVVPIDIIQKAITENKKDWMNLYKCMDIRAGKKKTDDVTHDIDCIVFVVEKILDVLPTGKLETGATPVPSSITYESQGKTFNIPTDVQQA